MRLLDLTLPTPAENLALDEALLDEAEAAQDQDQPEEVLRLWEPAQHFVVAGRSSRVEQEVNLIACEADQIPVFRRVSGGAAIVAGPGCLMYAVVLSYQKHPELRVLEEAHRYVLEQIAGALQPLLPEVTRQGISDLTWKDRKISGNSLRCCRSHLLYHGTLLYNFSLGLVGSYLGSATRQPAYRRERTHGDFVANAPISVAEARERILARWKVHEPLVDWPRERVASLVQERYSQTSWNLRI